MEESRLSFALETKQMERPGVGICPQAVETNLHHLVYTIGPLTKWCRPNGVDQMAGTKFADQMGKSAEQLGKYAEQMEKSAEQMEDLLTKWQAMC